MKYLIIIVTFALLSGCATTQDTKSTVNIHKKTETKPPKVFGYTPIDPLPVTVDPTKFTTNDIILKALPDETMRLAVGEVTDEFGITFGPATAGIKGHNYVVILDYIKFNTNSLPVTTTTDNNGIKTAIIVDDNNTTNALIPVYIGVGLRLTANVSVKKGTVDLGNLFALGLSGQTKNVSGTLIVQSLGISGRNITPLIPMPNELNSTTIQNAILALGTIKAKMYENTTVITPRVLGVYNTIGGGAEIMNGLISSILRKKQSLTLAEPQSLPFPNPQSSSSDITQ